MPSDPGDSGAPLHIPGLRDITPIGRGASSIVYRGHDEELKRWVAVKVLLADDPNDPARKRFQREREITANLGKHPHIVQVFTTGFTLGGLPYVVMEFYEEGSIADRIRSSGAFTTPEVVDIGIKVADAVDAAHRADVLHRDIKPANILISQYGPALADFGIARTAANLEWSQSLEQLTPMHAAPEILLGEPPSAQADIYSLGSSLYTMLAGRPPFAGPMGESPLRYQVRVAQEPVPPFARSDVPDALVEVIHTALSKDPADRFASAAEMCDALGQIETPRTVGSHPHQLVSPGRPAGLDVIEEDGTIERGGALGAPETDADATPSWTPTEPIPEVGTPGATPGEPGRSEDHLGPLVSVARLGDDAPTTARARVQPPTLDEPVETRGHRRVLVLIGALLVVLIAVTSALLTGANHGGPNSTTNAKSSSSSATKSARKVPASSNFTLTGAPSGLGSAISASGSSVDLHWTDNTGGQGKYLVWVISSSGKVTPLPVAGVGTTTALVSSLKTTAAYCFVVNAVGGPTGTRLAPACTCIRGGKLSGVPSGFPHLICSTS